MSIASTSIKSSVTSAQSEAIVRAWNGEWGAGILRARSKN
jgi:hypothetical protein